jgi:hypothetical protein
MLSMIFRLLAGEVEEMTRKKVAEERASLDGGLLPEKFWVRNSAPIS